MANTIKELKDKLEEMLLNGTRIPLAKKTMIDEGEVRSWFTELTNFLPIELEQARNIVSKETDILNDAREQANRELADARMKAEKTVSDAEQHAANVRAAAEDAARELDEKAHAEYDSAIAQANADARQIVSDAEQEAARLISQQEVLRQARVEADELTDRTRAELEEKHAATLQYLNGLFEETDRFVSSQLSAMRSKRDELNRTR